MRLFFDLVAPIYRWLTNNPMWVGSLSETARHLPPSGGRLRLLDIGCGHGNSSREFIRLRPDVDVTGLDFSIPMLRMARRLSIQIPLDRLSYTQGDALRLPFPERHFDAINAHSLYYMLGNETNQRAFLAECMRVLRPGGRLILLDPAKDGAPFSVIRRPYPLRVKAAVLSWHAVAGTHARYTIPEMAERLKQAGYTRILTERATDGYGVLSRGENPYPAQTSTPARIGVAVDSPVSTLVTEPAAAIDQIRGSAVFVLIQQTPDRPGWQSDSEPVRWDALLADQGDAPDSEPALIAFSSLPNAVAFMQKAVMGSNAPRISKIGKYPKHELAQWGLPVLLNPDYTSLIDIKYRLGAHTLTVNPSRAITGQE